MASKDDFEVQVMRDNRWVTETVCRSEAEAVAAAKRFLSDRKCGGAQVIRNFLRPDRTTIEKVIFSEVRAVKDDESITIVQIDEVVPRCQTADEFTSQPSRNIANRLLRNYMEKAYVTPSELIYNHKELKRLQDAASLLPGAVDRIAFLQTRVDGSDSRVRRDEIFKAVEQMSARARKSDSLELPKCGDSVKTLIEQMAQAHGRQDAGYLALVSLSRDLVNQRSWIGKLDRLCRLAKSETDVPALQMLDGLIADVLGSNVVEELLGWQAGLGYAIISMFDLADGKMGTEKSEAREVADQLNQLFAAGKLPNARLCVMDRAYRQMRTSNALYRTEPRKERETFDKLLLRTLVPHGFLNGPETAEALTVRFSRMIPDGGATGRRASILGIRTAFPDRAFGVMYLCNLQPTDYAKDAMADMVEAMDWVYDATDLNSLCQRTLPPKDRMLRATNAHRAMMASGFAEDVKKRMAEHIDGILEKFLIDEKIIEKLDHNESLLRDRAMRLVQFCGAGILPEGRALNRARTRVLNLLRQPNFDAHFVNGITDTAKAQTMLREFHKLLVRANFG
jgi:hypothetical protein